MSAAAATTQGALEERLEKLERLRALEVAKATGAEPWLEMPHQRAPDGDWYLWLLLAGRGCVAAGTLLYDPVADEHVPVEARTEPGWVQTVAGPRLASASYVKGSAPLYRVETETGDAVVVTAQHRFLTPSGWVQLDRMRSGSVIASGVPSASRVGGPRSCRTHGGSATGCQSCCRSCGPRPLPDAGSGLARPQRRADAQPHAVSVARVLADDPAPGRPHNPSSSTDRHGRSGCAPDVPCQAAEGYALPPFARVLLPAAPAALPLSQRRSASPPSGELCRAERRSAAAPLAVARCIPGASLLEPGGVDRSFAATPHELRLAARASPRRGSRPPQARLASLSWTRIVAVEPVGIGAFYDLTVPGQAHYLANGLWHHNSGKTDACAAYFDRFMRRNPGARGGIVAPTLGDAAEACVYGVSGLMAHNPTVRTRQRMGGTHVVWPNGSEAKLFGAYTKEDVERLRAGGNRHIYWAEELAAWRYLKEAWANMELGLRLGKWPHIIGSTTPKPRPKLRELMRAAGTALTKASMYDNPHLPAAQRERLRLMYEGTRIGRQELMGEYIEDVEGALWTYEEITAARFRELLPDMARVVVAVDPSGGDEEGNDEQGIVVTGRGVDGLGYVLADRSCKLSPAGWGRRAVQAYLDFGADRVVAETNFGGDLVLQNVKVAARDMGVEVATKKITASRGKIARAEPIAALYEQRRVRHVDEFPELALQMTTWTDDSGWSPDRMDALVWGFTELMLGQVMGEGSVSVPRGRIPGVGTGTSGYEPRRG